MKLTNQNYCATVVEIKTLIPLENCDNVQAALIMGQQVIVSKEVKIGDIGLYFPVECQLGKEYLSNNNLYKNAELNIDNTKKGYFEENGRIKCVKFRGHKSEGLFMPHSSIVFIKSNPLSVGDCFNELEGITICSKYIVKQNRTPEAPGSGKLRNKQPKETKIIDNQFRFHEDTSMLYKNLHKIKPDSLISITYKMHGTSGISSYVLCKKSIRKIDRIKEWFWNLSHKIGNIFRNTKYSFEITETEYDYIYSSRKVIKNPDINPNAQHYYESDIWGLAHERVKPFLQKGMTFYYEIVGYLPSGAYIQGPFDYGQEPGTFGIYIYRITSTNVDGKVIEFSSKQVQDFCKQYSLNAVPQLYYGLARDICAELWDAFHVEEWRGHWLNLIKERYNEKDCFMCKNKLPEEGVVIRIEGMELEAYKQKSTNFYEMESSNLDKNIIDIESEDE